jgi:hypothetical protein
MLRHVASLGAREYHVARQKRANCAGGSDRVIEEVQAEVCTAAARSASGARMACPRSIAEEGLVRLAWPAL